MKIYLAGENAEAWKKRGFFSFNRLASFFYIKDEEFLINRFNNFILDSGAFTFMIKQNGSVKWDEYIEKYAEFINRTNINNFFELDIDSIVGLSEVERLRDKLETLTSKKCIPVWHKSRGKEYWLKMVKNYDYVAIGGIVTREIKPSQYPYFTYLLEEARKENCKVHGLGFTNLEGLKKYPFYSVDSTAWLSGNKFGAVYFFNGETMEKQNKKEGQRIKTNETAIHNFSEWVKFSKYADKYL
jgi:hypothetical protein